MIMPLIERKRMATGNGNCDKLSVSTRSTDHARRESPSSGTNFLSRLTKQDALRARSQFVAPLQASLHELRSRRQVAEHLGISREMVRLIEVDALHKIACRLKHLAITT
jgi:DNA-directed RNA polymerase sigma subunit (sigma70/sigma32)